jgi:hypothetical protein
MFGGSIMMRAHIGSGSNSSIPAYAALSIVFGIAFHKVSATGWKTEKIRKAVLSLVFILYFLQFGILAYNPMRYIPNDGDKKAAEKLISRISGIEGEVLVLDHGYLPGLAGKKTHAHIYAIVDVIDGPPGKALTGFTELLQSAINEKKFKAIIVGNEWRPSGLARNYEVQNGPLYYSYLFSGVPGRKAVPRSVLVPRK